MRNIDLLCSVIDKGEPKEVKTRFGLAKVCSAILEDETGSIRINLWREQADIVRVRDTILIKNAFVRVFNEQLELNVGSDGTISVCDRP
jgi:ssDNA-binding replication factor A large subunit